MVFWASGAAKLAHPGRFPRAYSRIDRRDPMPTNRIPR